MPPKRSSVYSSYAGGFNHGTTGGIARRLGACVTHQEPNDRTEQRICAATDAWRWYEANDPAWRRGVEEAVGVQIDQLFPKLEPALLEICHGHLHDALFGVADSKQSLKMAARRHYRGGQAKCKQQ